MLSHDVQNRIQVLGSAVDDFDMADDAMQDDVTHTQGR
ncbi:hypothetical protein JOF47_001253 [Paeniglutamicibacter kerguelensis]|uniref:Uncharacterized protein n=1 Tax=Paeniglutamicibacter kerguelensis TaxID=254788 RepID=A0ABS4XB98_9MICC|nr:hypothetical protein [Paeniglutamicibacter kerguelensis]